MQNDNYQKLAKEYMDIWQEEWAAILADNISSTQLVPPINPENMQSQNIEKAFSKMLDMQKNFLSEISNNFTTTIKDKDQKDKGDKDA